MNNIFESWGNGLSDARAFLDHYNDVFLPCAYCPFERSYIARCDCTGESCVYIKNQALDLVKKEG